MLRADSVSVQVLGLLSYAYYYYYYYYYYHYYYYYYYYYLALDRLDPLPIIAHLGVSSK